MIEEQTGFRALDMRLEYYDIVRNIKESRWYDYIIVNDVASTVEELKSVLIAGKCRTERVLENVSELFDI